MLVLSHALGACPTLPEPKHTIDSLFVDKKVHSIPGKSINLRYWHRKGPACFCCYFLTCMSLYRTTILSLQCTLYCHFNSTQEWHQAFKQPPPQVMAERGHPATGDVAEPGESTVHILHVDLGTHDVHCSDCVLHLLWARPSHLVPLAVGTTDHH